MPFVRKCVISGFGGLRHLLSAAPVSRPHFVVLETFPFDFSTVKGCLRRHALHSIVPIAARVHKTCVFCTSLGTITPRRKMFLFWIRSSNAAAVIDSVLTIIVVLDHVFNCGRHAKTGPDQISLEEDSDDSLAGI
eukprot:scaffold119081_cov39-Attheya_sp.AAC.2